MYHFFESSRMTFLRCWCAARRGCVCGARGECACDGRRIVVVMVEVQELVGQLDNIDVQVLVVVAVVSLTWTRRCSCAAGNGGACRATGWGACGGRSGSRCAALCGWACGAGRGEELVVRPDV
eukprot:4430973-Amphidinium_carterae.1